MDDGNDGSNDTYSWRAMNILAVGVCLPNRAEDTLRFSCPRSCPFCAQSYRERRAVMEGDTGKRKLSIHMLNEGFLARFR